MRPSAQVDKLPATARACLAVAGKRKRRVGRVGPVQGSGEGRFARTSGARAQIWLGLAAAVSGANDQIARQRTERVDGDENNKSHTLSVWFHRLGLLPCGGARLRKPEGNDRRLAERAGPLPGRQKPPPHLPGALSRGRGSASQQTRVHPRRRRCGPHHRRPTARSRRRQVP